LTQVLVDKADIDLVQSPEQLLIKKEDSEELGIVLNSIPDIYRQVLENFYFREMTYEEIAKQEGVAIKTIASRLYRGKNLLREKWREKYETL
ncbi:MAG: sigma-70 family RNA polymerase sigma factor, partial [Tissierellia bacterium]|nr:sigma-70 family RNA polymerase sigma factor [Tissierellia bacterium]